MAVGNDFGFPSPAPGNLGFLGERSGGQRGSTPWFQLDFADLEFGEGWGGKEAGGAGSEPTTEPASTLTQSDVAPLLGRLGLLPTQWLLELPWDWLMSG